MDWYQRLFAFAERFELFQQGSLLLVKWAPSLLKLALILVAGHILTRIAQRLVRWGIGRMKLDRILKDFELDSVLDAIGFRSIADLLVRVTGFVGVCATIYLAADVVQIAALTSLVGAIIAYIPTLLTGAAIMLSGVGLAAVARRSLEKVLARRIERDELLRLIPVSVYFVVIGLTAVIATEQLGINVDLIQSVALITLASALVGVVGAFGLGGTPLFGQFAARFHARRTFTVGDMLEIGESSGRLVRFGPTVALLEVEGGRVVLPYERLVCSRVMRRASPESNRDEDVVSKHDANSTGEEE